MQKELVYEGAPLKMEPRAAYVQRKQDERHARPNSPHNQMNVGARHALIRRSSKLQGFWLLRRAGSSSMLQADLNLATPSKLLPPQVPTPASITCSLSVRMQRMRVEFGLGLGFEF